MGRRKSHTFRNDYAAALISTDPKQKKRAKVRFFCFVPIPSADLVGHLTELQKRGVASFGLAFQCVRHEQFPGNLQMPSTYALIEMPIASQPLWVSPFPFPIKMYFRSLPSCQTWNFLGFRCMLPPTADNQCPEDLAPPHSLPCTIVIKSWLAVSPFMPHRSHG